MQLGSKPEDLLFDFEHGHLEVGPPFRERKLDLQAVKDFDELTYTDAVLSRYTCRVDSMEAAESERILSCLEESMRKHRLALARLRKLELAKTYGVKDVDDLGSKGYWESGETFARRSVAQQEAKDVLKAVATEGRKVSDHEVLRVLRLWGFRQNETRKNVMREGQTWIYSDTLGVTTDRTGHVLLREESRLYPDFCRLLCRWLRDHVPAGTSADFRWTSININKNYAGRLHRDSNNMGPSMIKAFGDFAGGQLQYYPEDDKGVKLAGLGEAGAERVTINVAGGLTLFDGNRAHEVDTFAGERFSLVYFTCARFWKLPEEQREKLVACEFGFPTLPDIKRLSGMLRKPRGYVGSTGRRRPETADGTESTKEPFHFWPHDGCEKVALEKQAELYWKDRPAREVNGEAPKPDGRPKQSLGVKRTAKASLAWSPNLCLSIGPELTSKRHLELKGTKNVVEACELLNGDGNAVPKAIAKAGCCAVYSNRTKAYYLLWRDGLREEARATFGLEGPKPKKLRVEQAGG